MAKSLIRLDIESREYEAKLRQSKREFEDFTASIGINMKKMTAYGIALGAAAKAINAVTQTISECVTQSAEMSKAAEGIRVAFNRLNRPDLLDKLREATHGTVNDMELMKQAVKFNDFRLSLEEMGTMLAFAQQKAKDTGQSVDYMVDSIVTGLGRQSLMILDNLGLSAAEIKEKMKETGDMTKAVGEIIREQMQKAGDYVETAADRATQANVELENAMLELGNAMRETFGFTGWSDMATGIKTELVGALTFTIETINEAKTRFLELLQLMGLADKPKTPVSSGHENDHYDSYEVVKDQDGNVVSATKWERNKAYDMTDYERTQQGVVITGTKGRTKGTTKGTWRTAKTVSVEEQIQSAFDKMMLKSSAGVEEMKPEDVMGPSTAWTAYTQSIANAFETPVSPLQKLNEELETLKQELENAPDTSSYQMGLQLIADKEKEIAKFKGNESAKELPKIGDDAAMAWSAASSAVSSVGSALGGIQNPASNIVATIGQAVANIAMAYSEALVKDGGIKSNLWYFITAAAAATASMVATISTIHSSTGYADGGVIPGNSYSGDNQWVRVNAGETILTRAQAGNLASQLQSNYQGGNVRPYLEGETMYLGINNHTRRSGQGEIVTTGMLRRMGLM